MKKLTFKVGLSKDSSVISMIQEINRISCRIFLDIENGLVVVENINDSMIKEVIDLVDNYNTILNVDIDNTFEETMKESTSNTVTETVDEHSKMETDDVVAEKQSTVLEPQSEDDLVIKKVEFENEYVENRINSFLKTAYWALYNRHATEKEIGEYIRTCTSEISMRFSSKPIIEFALGDIVDVNYGSHLPGEIMGGHVHAIVCNILDEGMAYVVPITKVRTNITSQSYLFMDAPYDAIYYNEFYKGGTVLADKGKYVRAERFNSVIGKTTPKFFERLLYRLACTFDFTDCLTEAEEASDEVAETPTEAEKTSDELVETPTEAEKTSDEVVETLTEAEETSDEVAETPTEAEKTFDEVVEIPAEAEETSDEVAEIPTEVEETADEKAEVPMEVEKNSNGVEKNKTTIKRIGGTESALLEVIGFAFDKLDSSKKVEEQVEPFLTDIGMKTNQRMVTQAFIVACDIKRINYENVIIGLHDRFPKVREEIINNILKEEFKNWLGKYPTLAEKCPKISLMAVLKVFAKRLA